MFRENLVEFVRRLEGIGGQVVRGEAVLPANVGEIAHHFVVLGVAQACLKGNAFVARSINQHAGEVIAVHTEAALHLFIGTDHHHAAEDDEEHAQHHITEQQDPCIGEPQAGDRQHYGFQQGRNQDGHSEAEDVGQRGVPDNDAVALEHPEHQGGKQGCRNEEHPVEGRISRGRLQIVRAGKNQQRRQEGQEHVEREDEPRADVA